MRSQKTLANRIGALEQARGTGRSRYLWDDHDGKLELQIAALKESGEIGDGDQVRIFSWMPAASASGAPDDLRVHRIPQ
jgi:hypothetical protein